MLCYEAPGPHVWKGHRLCSRVIAVNSLYTSLLQPCVHNDGKPPPLASQMTTYCSPWRALLLSNSPERKFACPSNVRGEVVQHFPRGLRHLEWGSLKIKREEGNDKSGQLPHNKW